MTKRKSPSTDRAPLSLEHHISGEDGPTVGWLVYVDDHRQVWCGEISRSLFEEQNEEDRDALQNDFGWFLVLYDNKIHETKVVARALGEYSGRELAILYARGLIHETAALKAPKKRARKWITASKRR